MAFADYPQQAHAVRLLQRSLARGRLGHAYLFTGDELAPLEAMSRNLIKTVNCSQRPDAGESDVPPDCCDNCRSCRQIDQDTHPDLKWVRPESKSRVITIDKIRDVMRTVNLKPTWARWKATVLVAADRLNVQAANAFLKTLEEPPANSILILLSTRPERLLETILSRCLRLNVTSLAPVRLDEADASWLSGFAEMVAETGAGVLPRYRLLGQLLSRLSELKAEIETNLSARSPLNQNGDVEPKLRERWEEELKAAVEAEYRRRRGEVVVGLQWFFRDVWLKAQAMGDDLLSLPDLADRVGRAARQVSGKEAFANLQTLERTQRLLETNLQEALVLEVGLLNLKLAAPEPDAR